MKIIKKIMCWNNDLTNLENILILCYRVFTYIFPSGILLYDLVIAKLVDNEVSVATKLGCGGLFLLGVMILVAVIMLGRYFKKKIDEHIKDETINNKSNIELYYVGDKSLPNLVINN